MFGFMKEVQNNVVVSNRIFETVLYNLFISEELLDSRIYKAAHLLSTLPQKGAHPWSGKDVKQETGSRMYIHKYMWL